MIPGNTSSQGKYVDPPTSVSASAGNAEATVSFTLPVYDGKGVATYVATSNPSGLTASGASSPLTVTGLSNGTSYTFTVTTISGYGVSASSGASSAVTPVAPPFFPFFPTFTTAAPPFFPFFPTFTTANPCAGVTCPGYAPTWFGVNGAWVEGSYNNQPWDPHCIQAGYPADPPYCGDYGAGIAGSGYSYWLSYTAFSGCCSYNLFLYCQCA